MSWLTRAKSRPTRWQIMTSSSTALNVGEIVMVGTTYVEIYVTDDPDHAKVTPFSMSGPVTKFRFVGVGAGVGVGVLPVDLSASAVDMPSGGKIYCGALTPEGKQVQLSDLSGACTMEVFSADALAGAGYTGIYFGNSGGPPIFSRAIGITKGLQIGIPGAGAMQYVGRIWRTN